MDPTRTLLAACVALSLAFAPRPAAKDFEAQAKQFKNSNSLTQLADDEAALDASLDAAFVAIDVGIFDVRYLRSALSDAKHFDDLKGIVLGLIDLHVHLLAWVAEKDPGKPAGASTPELTTFRGWVAAWKPDLLKKITGSKAEGHDLAVLAGADAVHVGQDDLPVEAARRFGLPVGLSTHAPREIDAADADYIGVGPVHATPTKEGRPAVGLDLVRYAAAHARVPWFAIGGLDETTLPDVVAAGATRASVVRAIAEAADPEQAARRLRAVITDGPARA